MCPRTARPELVINAVLLSDAPLDRPPLAGTERADETPALRR
jgi:hypothetical protein